MTVDDPAEEVVERRLESAVAFAFSVLSAYDSPLIGWRHFERIVCASVRRGAYEDGAESGMSGLFGLGKYVDVELCGVVDSECLVLEFVPVEAHFGVVVKDYRLPVEFVGENAVVDHTGVDVVDELGNPLICDENASVDRSLLIHSACFLQR